MLLASWAVSKLVFLPREFSVTLKAPWQVVLILTYLLRGLLVYRGNGYTLYNSRRGFSHESRGENNRDCAYVPWENDGDRRPLATLAFDRKHFLIYHTFLPQESQEPHFACNAEFARLLHITMRSVEYTRSTINKLNTKNEKKKKRITQNDTQDDKTDLKNILLFRFRSQARTGHFRQADWLLDEAGKKFL